MSNITFQQHELVVAGLCAELKLYAKLKEELEQQLKITTNKEEFWYNRYVESNKQKEELQKHVEQQKAKSIEKAELVRHIKADVKRAMKSKSQKKQQKLLVLALQNLEVL